MEINIFDLNLVDFECAWKFQKQIFTQVQNNSLRHALILCRHKPVITLGRAGHKENILATKEELERKGISVYAIERGGDVTYHGPGQLTVYPVCNLTFLKKDIHWFLRLLEEALICWISDFGIKAERNPGYSGVWVEGKKIASIGIAIRHWITFHGISINIKKSDLDNFKLIKPCGLNVEMTCLEAILDRELDIENIKNSLINQFRDTLPIELQGVPA